MIDPNGKEMMSRFERVPREVLTTLNSLLHEGVHVKSFTYIRHRWDRQRGFFIRRKDEGLPRVKETDFIEIDWDLALTQTSTRRRQSRSLQSFASSNATTLST